MSENHRGPEGPEARVPRVECLDGQAFTSQELAITHFVKHGTLQNACTTRPRVVASLGRSAHSHIVRLMNSRQKSLKRLMTKVLWLCWKREIGKKKNPSQMLVTIDRGNLGREIKEIVKIHLNVDLSDARQLGCVFLGMTPPKSILRKGTDMPKPIPTCEVHKGYCTSYQNSRPKSLARSHLSRWTSRA